MEASDTANEGRNWKLPFLFEKLETQHQDVAMSQSGTGKAKAAREPPPTLFVHPSSTTSHVSLPGIMAPGVPSTSVASQQQPPPTAGLSQTGSLHGALDGRDSTVAPGLASPAELRNTLRSATATTATTTSATAAATATAAAPPALNIPLPLRFQSRQSTRTTDRTDALWAEMQATLEEVELSASGGTRVFGPDHDQKLAELRTAQIALAQAWARSEADEAIEFGTGVGAPKASVWGSVAADTTGGPDTAGGKPDTTAGGGATTDGGPKSTTAGTGSARPGSSGGMVGGSQDRFGPKPQETETDILLARKRREANDRYFQRVNQGVLDVVEKLDEVARAMRAVEQESKDIWSEGENDSIPGSAKS